MDEVKVRAMGVIGILRGYKNVPYPLDPPPLQVRGIEHTRRCESQGGESRGQGAAHDPPSPPQGADSPPSPAVTLKAGDPTSWRLD